MTTEAFISKITLESITLEMDGESGIWFKDGNLFAGHSIHIALNSENELIEAGIMG